MAVNYYDKFEYECFYHIYNRAADHESIFMDSDDYFFFLSKITMLLAPFCSVYSYSIMPNHFHLIVQINDKDKIVLQTQNETSAKASKYLSGTASVDDLLGDQLRRLFSSIGLRFNHK